MAVTNFSDLAIIIDVSSIAVGFGFVAKATNSSISAMVLTLSYLLVFFFFKQKPAYEVVSRDWSSDVCSSDLRHLITNPR